MVYVVGIGPGAKEYILPIAIDILSKCNRIIGFSRVLESLEKIDSINKDALLRVSKLSDVLEKLKEFESDNIAIVASGDPMFYGIASYIKNNFNKSIEIIPGISSFQYLSCKLGISWNGIYTGSLHGRDINFIKVIRNNEFSFWLTDKVHNPKFVLELLKKEDINFEMVVGENLSYESERISTFTKEDAINGEFSDLIVLAIKNKDYWRRN